MLIPQPNLRHQDVILTLFGMYGRPPHVAIPVASLVTLMGDLGFDSPGVRSAISRLKRKGILASFRDGGVASYVLDPSMSETISDGDERIFSEKRPDSGGYWALVTFSVPESQRSLRHQIRATLTGLGFGNVGQGLWIAPAANLHEAQIVLDRKGLGRYVEYFSGQYMGEEKIAEKVGQWWDLDELNSYFDEFLSFYETIAEQWRTRSVTKSLEAAQIAQEAFRIYVPMLTMWRRLPYLVPPLPVDVVLTEWNGPRVRAIFHEVHHMLSAQAGEYVDNVFAGGRRE
ncbi:PaaX family transcriptional regulator [Brevibacterium zhoupengii]|uniref:PaaX family transcriptional regulator n=1 Tax=Brevibacterium zhoupengii TaxID=2898795 RepID=UPI001E5A076D|nr:PaaX family transcriptional regulator C-terminal domain-containing protein [Brevibacterium zhoupengii]